MIEILKNFYNKSAALIKYLIDVYSIHIFRIYSIEVTTNPKEAVVIFINIRTGKKYSKNLEILFNDKKTLEQFNNDDAAQIGYLYGKALEQKK